MNFTSADPARVCRPLSLSAMVEAIHRMKARLPVPPKDYRIHPDDYKELKARLKAENPTFQTNAEEPSFLGLRLVLDENAPRQPRIG